MLKYLGSDGKKVKCMDKNKIILFSIALLISFIIIPTLAGAEEYEVTAADCDLNDDCVVNEEDQNLLLEYYGGDCDTDADINQDGRESSSDISYFMSFHGEEVPNCPPETFEPEEWSINFDWNETDNTVIVQSVSGNISWNNVTVILEGGSFIQQLTEGNVSEGDVFEVTSGNLSIFHPENSDPECWQNKHFYHIFEPIVEEEPEPVVNETETEPAVEIVNETMPEPIEDTFDGYTLSDIDFNGDGIVDCTDYNLFQENYNGAGVGTIYDINNDGKMNSADVSYFLNTAEHFGIAFDCDEEEPEMVETSQENDTIDPLTGQISNLETNITQLEAEKEQTILLRDAFSRALERWQATMSNYLLNFAYSQIESVFNAKIDAIDNEINSLNDQLLQLLSQQYQTFIPQ